MSSAALAARERMINRTSQQAQTQHVYRTDDLSGDYHAMILAEVLKVNPSLAGSQANTMASRIAANLERIINEEKALLGGG